MKHLRIIQSTACAALVFAALVPRAVKADEWDKKTIMKFSGDVQVPGATLPAGSYVFKLVESSSNRYIVQVFNERENHVFATILAIPNYRMEPPDKTVVTFYEAPSGQPLPVRAWFYPGDNFGREFVYTKSEGALIAKTGNQVVKTEETTTVAENTQPITQEAQSADQAQALATQPAVEANTPVEPVTPAPATAEPAPVPQPEVAPTTDADQTPAPVADTPAPAADTSSLPSTASQIQLVGLVGLLSLAGALSMRAVRRSN